MMATPQTPPGGDPFYEDLMKVEQAKTPQQMDIARIQAMRSGLATPVTPGAAQQQAGQQPQQPVQVAQPTAGDEFDQALLAAQQTGETSRRLIQQAYAGSQAITPTGAVAPTEGAAPGVDKDAKYDASDKRSMMGNLLLGGHMGLYELAARLEQLGIKAKELTGTMPKGTAQAFTQEFNRRYLKDPQYLRALHQAPIATRVGEFAGGTVPLMAIPFGAGGEAVAGAARAVPGLARLAPWLGRGAVGAGVGALQYDPTGRTGYQQAALGAGLGMALPGIGRGVGRLLGRAPPTPELTAAAQRAGVQLPTYPTAERALAGIPGTGVAGVIGERGARMAAGVRGIGQQIVGEAPGANYAKDFTGSLLDELESNRGKETGLRNKIDSLAEKTGKTINPLNFKVASSNALLDLQNLPAGLRGDASKKLISEISPYENSPNLRYTQLDQLKKQIGGQLDIASDASAGIPRYARSIYKRLYGGIKQDMDEFANREGGQLKSLHDEADKLYQNKILPFSKAPYNKLVTGDMTSKRFIGKFIRPDSEEDVDQLRALMPAGNPKALLSARAAVIDKALENADLPGAGFNGAKFANEAMKIDKATGNLLAPEQRETLKGYQLLGNYLEKVAPRSTNLAKIRRSGLHGSLMHMGGLGLAVYHPHVFLPIYLSGLGASTLFTTRAGQTILRNVAKIGATKMATKMDPLMRRAANIIFTKFGTNVLGQQ